MCISFPYWSFIHKPAVSSHNESTVFRILYFPLSWFIFEYCWNIYKRCLKKQSIRGNLSEFCNCIILFLFLNEYHFLRKNNFHLLFTRTILSLLYFYLASSAADVIWGIFLLFSMFLSPSSMSSPLFHLKINSYVSSIAVFIDVPF